MDSIKIKDRSFIFQNPTAWDGCILYDLTTSYDIPFGAAVVMGIQSIKQHMSAEQLIACMKLCLRYCTELIENPDNPDKPYKIRVIDEIGGIAINNATPQLLTKLTAQYILFFVESWQSESS